MPRRYRRLGPVGYEVGLFERYKREKGAGAAGVGAGDKGKGVGKEMAGAPQSSEQGDEGSIWMASWMGVWREVEAEVRRGRGVGREGQEEENGKEREEGEEDAMMGRTGHGECEPVMGSGAEVDEAGRLVRDACRWFRVEQPRSVSEGADTGEDRPVTGEAVNGGLDGEDGHSQQVTVPSSRLDDLLETLAREIMWTRDAMEQFIRRHV